MFSKLFQFFFFIIGLRNEGLLESEDDGKIYFLVFKI